MASNTNLYLVLHTDPNTGNIFKTTIYQPDGTTVDYISEFDPNTGELVKETNYHPDGTISDIFNF
ncbi:DUF2963 domain-containing protein [Candidatus Phytoplasma solani]|uniref:DUF2963 domain-containing protein n=1 Tax=Candidatus Phytoplasma solani TaxID=69896 RepID=UPI003590140C